MSTQKFTSEIEQEQDQRWIAEVLELPGVMAYDRLEHGESVPEFLHITFEAA